MAGTNSARVRRVQGKDGEYSASSSRVGRLVALSRMMLSWFCRRKAVRSSAVRVVAP